MALPKLFQRIFWHNNTTPAINEDNLNAISKGLSDVDDRVIELATEVMEKVPELEELAEQLEEGIQNPPYIGTNGNWYIWNTTTQAYADSGVDASITVNIADVTMLAEGATPYVTNTGTSTDPVFHLFIPRGATGATGATGPKGDTGAQGPQGIQGIQGEQGETGATPNITMSATADATASATPSVQVTKSGTAEAPSFALAFSGLKGTKGDTGSKGDTGATGNGIESITKTGTQGLVDTYTITMTDGSTATFTVTNGQDGQGAGDMLKSTYDSNNAVANAGGIASYVSDAINTAVTSALSASY